MPLFGYPIVPANKFKTMVKCSWLDCIAGGGLSGVGKCFFFGIWWHQSCPLYQYDQPYEEYVKNKVEDGIFAINAAYPEIAGRAIMLYNSGGDRQAAILTEICHAMIKGLKSLKELYGDDND